MPVVRLQSKVCHFAHIPKCGGSSVEMYLHKIGASVGFLDNHFQSSMASKLWHKSSPQHIDGKSMLRLFPKSFFDFSFAVVRNPFTRFVSAFKFHMLVENNIQEDVDINEFVVNDLEFAANELGVYDNHFHSQISFFAPNYSYTVFRIENGLEPVKQYIDANFFGTSLAAKIDHHLRSPILNQNFALSNSSREIIKTIYSEDFQQLSYETSY